MDEFVKVPIYPVARWLDPREKQRRALPVNKVPEDFTFMDSQIHVDDVVDCGQGVSRKVGGRGFRFTCKVSWGDVGYPKSKHSILWYDDFYDEWFVEVPKDWALRMGIEYQDYVCTAERE